MSALPLVLALLLGAEPRGQALKGEFLYNLSTFTGPAKSDWAQVAYDRTADELFAAHGGTVGIYNRLGMLVHEFGGDGALGSVLAAAPMPDGDVLVLSSVDGKKVITRCDYRGEPLVPVEIRGLPDAYAKDFSADHIVFRDGKLYVADARQMLVAVMQPDGAVTSVVELKKVLKFDKKELEAAGLRGLGVDGRGRILVTFPLIFRVGVISPDGSVKTFGARGSVPGKFNIIGKMTADEAGNYYLTDTLRSVVMVFDPELNFLGEFGYRGEDPDNLVIPVDVAAGGGKVFVAQGGGRGVAAFRVKFPPPPPTEPAGGAPATSAPASPPSSAAPR